MKFGQLLAGQRGGEIGIAGPNQVEDLLPERIGDLVVGAPAPVAGNRNRPFQTAIAPTWII